MVNARFVDACFPTAGGMITAGTLRMLAESAISHGNGELVLTARQEIAVPRLSSSGFAPLKHRLPGRALYVRRVGMVPNIVTTCPAAGAGVGRAWLREGVFADILSQFPYRASIPVTIADPGQAWLPASLSILNFLAAPEDDRWHARIALDGGAWAVLDGAVRTADIPDAIRRLQFHLNPRGGGVAPEALPLLNARIADLVTPSPYTPPAPLRHYDGAHGMVSIPALDGTLSAHFLHDLCVWALQCDISSFGITPWKTLVVRRHDDARDENLQRLLLRMRVPMEQGPWRRHWYESDALRGGPAVSTRLRNALNRQCPVSTGLAVAVISAEDAVPDAHIIIRENAHDRAGLLKRGITFDLLLRAGDARATLQKVHARGVRESDLCSQVLRALDALAAPEVEAPPPSAREAVPLPTAPSFRCAVCLTEYCEALGDPLGAIPPHTPFDALPASWECPTCGEAPAAFQRVSG